MRCCHEECDWEGTVYTVESHIEACIYGKTFSWKEHLEKKVVLNPCWREVVERRGWDKHLFHGITPSEGISFRNLYAKVTMDIQVDIVVRFYS